MTTNVKHYKIKSEYFRLTEIRNVKDIIRKQVL